MKLPARARVERMARGLSLQTRLNISMVILGIDDFDVTGFCDVISPDHFVRGFYNSSFRRCTLGPFINY